MMPRTLRFILGDQLSHRTASLTGLDRANDIVLMAEVRDETRYVPHHPKKIALIFSAMRHFAAELEAGGVTIDYVRLDDPANGGGFRAELARAVKRHQADRVIVAEAGEYRVAADMAGWERALGVPVEIRADRRFFCSRQEFARWAEDRRQLRMEFFYREMRRRHGVLLEADGEPAGGQWNFDAENRKALPAGLAIPTAHAEPPDAITRDVLTLVSERFGDHFGDLDGFDYAIDAAGAARAFEHFVACSLPFFGDFQDAMRTGEGALFHAIISPYLNCGLLDAKSVVARVEAEYRAGRVALNAAEGFIRQILGWREYVRGIYWLKMPDYAETNFLDAHRDLPGFYWTGETPMNCLAQCIGQTKRQAYAHHIQRLMVTGNFALLIDCEPRQICDWYLAVYADAYEWVELPNTHGMVMHADGGYLGSKPYIGGGAYINRMSDYCGGCSFDVAQRVGPKACPFNYLYWDFLIRHRDKLGRNPRLALPYRSLDRMTDEKRAEIAASADAFLGALA